MKWQWDKIKPFWYVGLKSSAPGAWKELRKLDPLCWLLTSGKCNTKRRRGRAWDLKSIANCKIWWEEELPKSSVKSSEKQQEKNQDKKNWTNRPLSGAEGSLPQVARRPVSWLAALLWESAAVLIPFLGRVQVPGIMFSNAQFLPVSRSGFSHPVPLPGRGGKRPRAGLSRENTK